MVPPSNRVVKPSFPMLPDHEKTRERLGVRDQLIPAPL